MKRKTNFLIVLAVLLSNGCNDYTVKTKINPDGSFMRTIVCDGDSLGLYKIHLPYVFADSWKIDIQPKPKAERSFITTATKTYANDEQLTKELSKGRDSSKLQITCRIEKQFRWFFSYYRYSETLPSYGIYRHLSVDSFFTPAEIGLIKENTDSLVKKRVEEFWVRNIIEEFIQRLVAKTTELHDPLLPPSMFYEHKGELTEALVEEEADKPEKIEGVFEKALSPRPVKKIRGMMDSIFTHMTEELKHEMELEVSYKNEVVMPGILTTTNAKKIEGNKVMWDCKSNAYFDIVMTAESRMVNLWTIIATSVVCLLLIIGLLLPILHRRRIAAAH